MYDSDIEDSINQITGTENCFKLHLRFTTLLEHHGGDVRDAEEVQSATSFHDEVTHFSASDELITLNSISREVTIT